MRCSGRFSGVFLWIVLSLFLPFEMHAQSITTGELLGSVTDPQNRPMAGAVLTLISTTAQSKTTVIADKNGRYLFSNVQPGTYSLAASASGFTSPATMVTVRVGSSTKIDFDVKPAGSFTGEVTVSAQAPPIETIKSQVNKYISFQEIQNLPLQNRQFLDVLNVVPGVTTGVPTGTYEDRGPRNSFTIHGARSNQNDFLLDGASNNDKSDLNYEDIASVQILGGPRSGIAGRAGQTFQVGTALQTYNLDAIQEVQVSTSMFSAEFGGGGSGGVVNVITRSGTDQLAGNLTLQEQRDAWITGSNKQDVDRLIGGLAIGGPIVKDRTHFFASYERDNHKLGYDFSQPSYYVPAYLAGLGLTANHTLRDRFTAKIDQGLSDQHSMALTANYINERADVLQTIFRERSIDDVVPEKYKNASFGAIFRDLGVIGGDHYLETVVNGTKSDRDFNSLNDNPREIFNFYEPSYHSYTVGENSPDATNTIGTLGVSEKMSWSAGKFSNKAGIGADYFKQRSRQVEYVSLYHYPEDGTTGYLRIPETDIAASVTDLWAFAQTDWFVNPRLTWNVGVRLGHDNLVGQTTAEPRVGIAFDPHANGKQVIRAGIGLYHDRTNLVGQTGALRPPAEIGDVVDGEFVPDGAPYVTVVDPDLKLPSIYKAVLGYQRQFGTGTTAGVTLFANWNRDLFYVDTLNRPDKNGTRPNPDLSTITFYSNYGKSDVYDVEFEGRHRFSNNSLMTLSYTYERSRGNSAFDFISGNDPINRGTQYDGQMKTYEVWGPLPYDLTHNLKFSAVLMLPLGIHFSTFANWHTGRPYYWYTTWYELPEYYPHFEFYGGGYNSQRLDNFFNTDVRLAKSFPVRRTNIEIFFDGFNVTDRENVLSRNQLYAYNYGAPIGADGTVYYKKFDTPTFYGPRRSAQVGARFTF